MKQISINGTQYVHSFVLANVDKPITGWPFMLQFELNLKWTSKGCILVDQRRHMRSYLKIHSVQSNLLGIAPVDQPLDVVPPAYRTLFNQFPGILSPTFQTNPSHGVHHIKTGQAPPCRAKVRPLMPGSPKEIKGKAAWMELESLGVIERVNPQDSNPLTTA